MMMAPGRPPGTAGALDEAAVGPPWLSEVGDPGKAGHRVGEGICSQCGQEHVSNYEPRKRIQLKTANNLNEGFTKEIPTASKYFLLIKKVLNSLIIRRGQIKTTAGMTSSQQLSMNESI